MTLFGHFRCYDSAISPASIRRRWTCCFRLLLDLRLPDGQLVEYYLTVKEVMDANDNVHHPLFEEWRERETNKLTGQETLEYEQALDKSNDAFDQAWAQYLKRTGQSEASVNEVMRETDEITR